MQSASGLWRDEEEEGQTQIQAVLLHYPPPLIVQSTRLFPSPHNFAGSGRLPVVLKNTVLVPWEFYCSSFIFLSISQYG